MDPQQLPLAVHLFQGHWFSRNQERLELTSNEVEFIVATLGTRPKKWDGSCQTDIEAMQRILDSTPSVLDRIGSRLLGLVLGFRGGGPAVQLLIEQGMELKIDPWEYNELHEAGHSGAVDSIRALFESGMCDAKTISVEKPHTGWPSNLSLLYWAAWGGYPEFASVCLQYGAAEYLELEIVGNGERGTTVLQESLAPSHWSEEIYHTIGKRKTALVLLEAGAEYDIFSACARNDLDRLNTLLDDDLESASRADSFGSTPLHWAVRANSVDCVKELLRNDVPLDVMNRSKRTAVQWGAEKDSIESIRLLAQAGADLNTQDGKGRTPLHRATYEGKVGAAEALIECGANVSLTNKKGKTAFEIARKEAGHFKKQARL